MTQPLRELAGRLGNPLGRIVTDADLLELIARAEHLAELTERVTRAARTLLHACEDGQPLHYATAFGHRSVIDATASEVAEFRALVSAIKTAIPTH